MMLKKLIVALFLFSVVQSFAQSSKDYKAVDDYVKSLGSLDTLNMGTISATLTQNFPDKLNQTRAIFDWIAFNIRFDCKDARNGDNDKINSDDILKSRTATAAGYAALFQDMCSVAGIRCLTVDGFIKRSADDINQPSDEFNHSWDVVQLGQSPDQWFYVDPTWGSGYTDKSMKVFTKSFNDAYFFADKTIFNLQHFPDNINWQLGGGPKNKKDFYALPFVRSTAYEFNVTSFDPVNGYIKLKTGKAQRFTINSVSNEPVSTVALAMGDDKKKQTKQVNFSSGNGVITFNYTFDNEDTYPVSVLINGKEVITYMVEVD